MMRSIVIQAGGISRRFGQDKAHIDFHGQPLVQHIAGRLRGLGEELIATGSRPIAGIPTFEDDLPGFGSLGGLLTALQHAAHPLLGLAACDMPFASPRLFQSLFVLLEKGAWDAVVPSTPAGLEPLHAVYRREACLPAVLQAIQAGERRMVSWLPVVRALILTPQEVAEIDPSPWIFFNINTPADLETALTLPWTSPEG